VSSEKPRRYQAYYFGFEETKDPLIDKILSAICFAGKGYHNTAGWVEETSDYGDYTGGSYEGWIQTSANEAAEEITKLKEALREAVEVIGFYANGVAVDPDFDDMKEVNDSDFCNPECDQQFKGRRAREFQSKHAAIIAEITKGGANE
jgi:hypothetical protein